ncbi:hypothetical protein G7046_g6893 [Stylonectria norvegica]|nr:hypothetical protein G7046_g6893 [Stylonectria norvegica]
MSDTSSHTLYDGSITTAINALNALSRILKAAEQHPDSAKLPSSRLIEDMQPLTFQVWVATDTTCQMVAQAQGLEPLKRNDDMKTYEDMKARIAETLEQLEKADKDRINKRENELVPCHLGDSPDFLLPSKNFIFGYCVPNIFFHVTIAYAIVRHHGVDIGKIQYIPSFIRPYVPWELPA